jgi:hypothetical protein
MIMNTSRCSAGMVMSVWTVFLAAFLTNARAAEPPELLLPPCPTPPRIDGVLDDACWAGAPTVATWHVVGTDGTSTQHRAWVTCDAEWLYAAFDVAQPAADRLAPRARKHDENVQREDNVQVSFDPGTNGTLYYQFLLSKANVRADFRMTKAKGREREEWNIPWRSATRQSETGWQAEIAVPLVLLLTAGDVRQARLNLLVDTFSAATDQRLECSWAALTRDFHEPEHFGALKGLEQVTVQAPFLPFLVEARVSGYELAAGAYSYQVVAQVQALGTQGGKVRLTVTDRPAAAPPATTAAESELQPSAAPQAIAVRVPVTALVPRTALLSLAAADTGEVLQETLLDDTTALTVFAADLDRSYYTGEAAAVAHCRLGLPPESLQAMVLRARDAQGKVLARQDAPQAVTGFRVPLETLPEGENAITVELCQRDGTVVSGVTLNLTRRAPRPGREWKVDRVNRVLLRDGKPFFPCGFLMSNILARDEYAFKEVAEAGFTSVFQWYGAADPATDPQAYLAAAAKYNLQVVLWPDHAYSQRVTLTDPGKLVPTEALAQVNRHLQTYITSTSLKSYLAGNRALSRRQRSALFAEYIDANLPRFAAVVRTAATAPNVMGYNIFDEPQLGSFDQQDQGRALYRMVRDLDGYRPCFLLYSSEIPAGAEATDWCDVLGTDPYWVPAGRQRHTVNYVAEITARTRRRADAAGKVTYIVPMAEFWSESGKRAIRLDEQRCQTYLALIHGARGLFYFFYPVTTEAGFAVLRDLAQEMKTLGPVCVTPDLPQTVTYTPGELDPERRKFTDVQVCLKRHPESGYVLLCANTRECPVDATFTLAGLPDGTAVARLFSQTALTSAAGAFAERIEGFGVRAYRIAVPGLPEPVRLAVGQEAHPELAQAEPPGYDLYGRTEMKNNVPNPSFEEVSVPGWPDYWKYTGGPAQGERIGGPGALWGVDTDRPFHGKHCLRMSVQAPERKTVTYSTFYPRDSTPQEYCLSWYARASRDVTLVLDLRTADIHAEEFAVGTEWRRYHARLPIATSAPLPYCTYRFVLSSGKAPAAETSVWLDAVQVERGTEPTEFEP